jgi:hypothetical protein
MTHVCRTYQPGVDQLGRSVDECVECRQQRVIMTHAPLLIVRITTNHPCQVPDCHLIACAGQTVCRKHYDLRPRLRKARKARGPNVRSA